MSVSQTIHAMLRYLRETADGCGAEAPTDAELLERFVRGGDGVAFAALVARHGPMVLGVCRRAIQNAHDAEDAFQATFLVLARKAGALGRCDSVGAWLYGVACRTAAHARSARARRQDRERWVRAMPADEPTPAVVWDDLRPVLDEEVRRLPNKYRVPVVLCYLDGKTYDEAAREIGCPKGTVATRLARARELLRERLSGRGISLSIAGLTAVLADHARAAVPAPLLTATVEAVTTSVAPAGVAILTERVLKAMCVTKLKAVAALMITVGLLAGAGALALAHRAAGPTADQAAPGEFRPDNGKEKPAEPPDRVGWLRIHEEGEDGRVLLIRPDGSMRTETAHRLRQTFVSPDGTHILSVKPAGNGTAIFLVDAGGKFERQVSPGGLDASYPCWSPDGKRIAFLGRSGEQWQVHEMGGNGGDNRQVTDLPNGAGMPAYAPDGRLSYLSFHMREKCQKADLVIDGGKDAKLVVRNTCITHYAWSPDGRTIAYGKPGALVFHEVGSGKEQVVAFPDVDRRLDSHAAFLICWSPNSRTVACRITFLGDRRQGGPRLFGDDELFVVPRSGKPRWFQPFVRFQHVEWIELPARAEPGPQGLQKTLEGFRKELPPPHSVGEQNGFAIKDVDGKDFLGSHLSGVASRLRVKTRAECLVLLTFLKDRDPKIRFIAATAIENVVRAYPEGMSVSDITEIDSDGHREMIRRFIEKIDRLSE